LKRDPFLTKIEEVVDREWAAIQEDNAEKKRQKAALIATTGGAAADINTQKRLEFLELFV